MFISCQIENPHFDSQTKETLTSKIANFGSECIISDKFISNIVSQTNIIEILSSSIDKKNTNELAKVVDSQGTKYGSKMIVPKLYDAQQGIHSKHQFIETPIYQNTNLSNTNLSKH